MRALFILNHGPYGTEHSTHALRLARALNQREHNSVRVCLMGDAVWTAKRGQKPPSGALDLGAMLDAIAASDSRAVAACGGCMDARGMTDEDLLGSVHRGTLDELADWSEWADKVFTF